MAIYSYSRVSSDDQDATGQEIEILKYCNREGIQIDEHVSESISSRKNDREIFELIKKLISGDLVICTELSRLTRGGVADTFRILAEIRKVGADLIAIRDHIDTRSEFASLSSEILISVMALSHRIERDKISERTKAGLVAAVRSGSTLGRKPLAKGGKTSSKLDIHINEITIGIENDVPLSKLAKKFGTCRMTMSKFVASRGLKAKE